MKVRRCPMCHRANEATAWRCDCGYEFGQSAEKALELLRSQRRNLRITLFLSLVLFGAFAGLLYAMLLYQSPVIVVGGVAGLGAQIARTLRRLSMTRESMRQLEERTLPKARLLEG